MEKSTAIVGLIGTVLSGIAIYGVIALSHRGLPAGPYSEGSVCHRLQQARANPWLAPLGVMVKQKSPGEDNAFKAGEAYSRAQSEASKEIARLIRGMLAANAALGKKPPQNRLFCNEATLRSALAEPQHTFANRYFSDLDQRISDKKLTCQTEFVDDLAICHP